MTGDSPKDLKKSDTLQIRIPHETKKEFLEACQEDRVSASEVLRRSILDYLSLRKRPSSQERKGLQIMIPKTIRKKRFLVAGLAGASALSVFAAMPSAAEPDFQTAFRRLDINRDGKLDISEFSPAPFPNAVLAREARVNDAKGLPRDILYVQPGVSQKETNPRDPTSPNLDDDFRRFDADGDGSVSYDEFQASLASMIEPVFAATDANNDGKLSQQELTAPLSITANMVESLHPAGPLPGPSPEESFRIFDRNGDGAVTFEEFVPQP
jgi:Ca2+-binding EF-hand superfamily protein